MILNNKILIVLFVLAVLFVLYASYNKFMAKLKRKIISILARLRNYFILGIVVLVPIGITLYLTKFFISISSKLIPNELNPNSYLPFAIPGLEILFSIIFITINWGFISFIYRKKNT